MFINQVINQKISVNCKTIEEAQRIIGLSYEAKCFWINNSHDKVYWTFEENTCYNLSKSLTHGPKKYFSDKNYQIIDSTDISDHVWVKECSEEGLYWVTRDFEDIFHMYLTKVTLDDYWYLPIPNSKKPIYRKTVNISVLDFRNKLYTRDGLPIDVDHYVCYNDRVQVVDVNGKVFDGPFYE